MDKSDGRCQVLLAEDNPVNMELAKAVLALVDCDVTPVEDGLRALEAFKQKKFHLLLLDYHMPLMDGSAVASAVRAFEATQQLGPTWIVALTGSAMPAEYQRCMDAGMNEVLTKPMDVGRLRDLVSEVCKREHAA
ncbi:response regulator [Aquabacterium sp.]|uniref:response regulator n=1 Tax=Aquabacterium sp. TaxID=1872578 RepID=UPI003D6C9306